MSELKVGVSGIRGIVGETLTPETAVRFAMAFGTLIGPRTVVLGRDTRPSGQAMSFAVASGLMAAGCEVIDLGVVSTPGLSLMITELQAGGGAMITASHNPSAWNGIKFFRPDGIDLSPKQGVKLREIWTSGNFKLVAGPQYPRLLHDDTVHTRHVDKVLRTVDKDKIRERRLKVVIDCVHGAGTVAAPSLLSALGCKVHILGGQGDGLFDHPPEPIAENLDSLCEAVHRHGADVGLALDPDADRLALVDEQGRFIGEEYTLALCTLHRLSQQAGPVAVNLSSSRMSCDVAARHNQPCYLTAVGEVNVADRMVAEGCIIGGEGNGGIIDPRICPIRNSFAGMAMVLEMLATRSMPLSAIVDELPRYTMLKSKGEATQAAIGALLEQLPQEFPDAKFDTQDGIRMDWPEGWLHVRGSNTEPIYRSIGESADAAWLHEKMDRVAEIVRRILDAQKK